MAENNEFAREIRKVGETLMKNADILAGSDEFTNEINISITIGRGFGTPTSCINVGVEKNLRA